MTRSDEYIATKSKLAALLAERGWVPLSGSGLAIATKPYQTAVGVKEAIAYLVPSNEGGCHFQASYASEGRNVLSTIRAGWKAMTYAEDAAELETRAVEFTAEWTPSWLIPTPCGLPLLRFEGDHHVFLRP